MMHKYQLLNTATATQKANNLDKISKQYSNKYNKNFLFDFSLLEKHISNSDVLTEIKNQCYKHCSGITSKFISVFKPCDIFATFDYYSGNLFFKPYSVYSDSKNKRVYVIMQLVKIENLTFQTCNNIYDDFETIQIINDQTGFENSITDCNIA